MSNTVFQLRRNTTSGVRPTTSSIQSGELAVNLTDGILFSTNGSVVFEVGGNLTSTSVGNSTVRYLTVNSTSHVLGNTIAFVANGSNGAAGQVLTSNGTGAYWGPVVVNTAAQYTWTNTQTFSANITFSSYIFANNVNATSFTTSSVTANATSILIGNTTSAFFANSTVQYVGNSTQNTSANSTYLVTNSGIFLTPQSGVASNTSEGSVFYDSLNHALNFYTDDASTPIEVGQQQIFRAVNKTGATLAFGAAVYISGAQGNRPTVALAQANSATTYDIAGFVLSSSGILNNAEGNILAGGLLQGYNTSSFTAGTVVYLSATTAGALTSTPPTYPNYSVAVGQILNSTNNGRVYVEIVPNYLGGIPNTAISISNGSLLTYSNNFTFDYANNVLHVGNSSANASVGYVNAAGSFSFMQIQNAANTSVEESLTNQSNAANASSDMIVYDSSGFAGPNYLDMGINGNGFSQPSSWTINGPSDGYFYTSNTNLSIGTGGPNYLNFFTGNTLIANERMRITAGGNVGIGNTAPDALLHVHGTANIIGNVVHSGTTTLGGNLTITSTAGIIANGSAGTIGQVLASNGTAVYWNNAGGSVMSKQEFTANGTQNTFTFSGGYQTNSLSVYINGVLSSASEVTATNGTTFTFTANPPNNAIIDAVGISGLYANGISTIVSQQFTANGTANSFAISGGYTPNQVMVFLNGVKQIPGTDVVITSGSNVNFIAMPANTSLIDVFGYQTSVVYAANGVVLIGNTTIGTGSVGISNGTTNTATVNSSAIFIGNSSVNTNITANTLNIGSTLYAFSNGNVGIGTSSPIDKLNISDGTVNFEFKPIGGSSIGYFGTRTNHALGFTTNDTEAMRIDTSGNIGIGTTNSGAWRLAVVGGIIQLSGGTTSQAGLRVQYASSVATITGINNDNNAFNPIAFYTSASEAMRIDTSGNVGIGTSSPSSYAAKFVSLTGDNTSGIITSASTALVRILGYSSGKSASSIESMNTAQSAFANLWIGGNILQFATSGAEAMRVDSSGNVMVGTTSAIARFTVGATTSYTSSASYGYLTNPGSTTGTTGWWGGGSQALGLSIYASGRIWGQEVDAFSDMRLKNIQREIDYSDALKFVKGMRGFNYTWKSEDNGKMKAGFLAQEVIKAGFDHMVSLTPNDKLEELIESDGFVSPAKHQFSINYDQTIPYLTVALKNAIEKIELLESRLVDLEAKVGAQ